MSAQKKEIDKVIAKLDLSQLPHESNKINVTKEATKDKPSDFVLAAGINYTNAFEDESFKADPNPVVESEMERFSKELSINEAQLRQNKGMVKILQAVDANERRNER